MTVIKQGAPNKIRQFWLVFYLTVVIFPILLTSFIKSPAENELGYKMASIISRQILIPNEINYTEIFFLPPESTKPFNHTKNEFTRGLRNFHLQRLPFVECFTRMRNIMCTLLVFIRLTHESL